jgi:signal transduction histidine kinase
MRPPKNPYYLNCRFGKEVDEQYTSSGEFVCQAIENADGVPYQLVFGPGIGEGYYLTVGYGIKQLMGVVPGEFTEELFQQMIEEIIPLSDDIPADAIEARKKLKSGGIGRYRAEIQVTTLEGDKKWIRDTSLPVIDDKTGNVTGLLGIYFDITEHKQTLVKLEKAMERATESDRLKTAFLNNLSHEIRTPLNAIVGFSTLLGEPGYVSENRVEYLDIISRSSDHLLEILDDVVEISKIEAKIVKIIRKELNLNGMLERVYDRFKPAATAKNILLRYDTLLDESESIIITDGYKLFQTLTNLVANAVKFTKTGIVEFGYFIKDDKLEFYVSDTGIGIVEEHHPNIFKPFFQVESSSTSRYEGTGLGLAIAKAYTELLGGKIWFTSEPGQGSVFCFTVPCERKQQ